MTMKIQLDNRRDFIKTTAMATGAILMPGILQGKHPEKVIGKEMEQLKKKINYLLTISKRCNTI